MSLQLRLRKQGQGMIVRLTAGIVLLMLVAFGCTSLVDAIGASWWQDGHVLPAVPFFEFEINNGQLISFFVFLGGAFGIYTMVVNHPAVADFLIETESELRKVSWPEMNEFFNATIVVLITIFVIAMFLAVADFLSVRFIETLRDTFKS